MGIENVFSPVDIAVSGLRAQSLRINVIANNIANANSRLESGQPYRRQNVVLSSSPEELSGVTVVEVAGDFSSAFKSVYQPGHPDANEEGYLVMPNVDLPVEMMHMVMASRAYQANTAVLKRYQEMADVTLELLR
jgi:flagellar basal-body rod protein FlgC